MSEWETMHASTRHPAQTLRTSTITLPATPGVYALYREDEPYYVGVATSLRQRVGRNHLQSKARMDKSALRRNIAETLGISTSAAIARSEYQPTDNDQAQVNVWLDGCEISWLECETRDDACALEERLIRERKPRLNKRG